MIGNLMMVPCMSCGNLFVPERTDQNRCRPCMNAGCWGVVWSGSATRDSRRYPQLILDDELQDSHPDEETTE